MKGYYSGHLTDFVLFFSVCVQMLTLDLVYDISFSLNSCAMFLLLCICPPLLANSTTSNCGEHHISITDLSVLILDILNFPIQG